MRMGRQASKYHKANATIKEVCGSTATRSESVAQLRWPMHFRLACDVFSRRPRDMFLWPSYIRFSKLCRKKSAWVDDYE